MPKLDLRPETAGESRDARFHRRDETAPNGRTRTAFLDSPALHDAAPLAKALRDAIAGEVRFDATSRALYAADSSNYRQPPIGVVLPRSPEDVVAAMAVCREMRAPVLLRGGGTSLCGQCCNTAVIIDCSKHLNRILAIDPERRIARVQPGVILDHLRDAAEEFHLTFGPDPSTHDHNTLGGMIGNNSCGVHSVTAGRTLDNVIALDILTHDGLRMTVGATGEREWREAMEAGGRQAAIYRGLDDLRRRYGDLIRRHYPNIPRRVSGYSLDSLLPENGFNLARALVGSEGTCVAVLSATLRLVPSPPARVILLLGYPSVFEAGDAVPDLMRGGPIGLEGIDEELVEFMRMKHLREEDVKILPEGCGWLVAEFGGETPKEARDKAQKALDGMKGKAKPASSKLLTDPDEQNRIWRVRRSGLGATAFVPGRPDAWEGWEDSAVAPDRVGHYLRELKALFKKYDYDAAIYGHFGDGCIHCRINFGLRTEEGLIVWRRFLDEAADLVVRYGGSISGEHGDGQSKADLLPKMYGPELIQAFREFKAIWDPAGAMNPGKIVDPFPITSNLRVGPDYRPPRLKTHFSFPDDGGNFAHAAMRCVGVGTCRRENSDQGVMCPSYLVTRDEQHVTRGRAHLLFEMLHGGIIGNDWHNPSVEAGLSLCLSCKGCKSDCPVNVDMATYKAEFRAHHYAGRLRPRAAYSMGLIHRWARIASFAPPLANIATRVPGIADLAKWAGGISPHRRMPPFASRTFTRWFNRRERAGGGSPVLLWPDTFNNYFRPDTAIAATRVLEAGGWRVTVPSRPLCCGRPLYDWGMLDEAKRLLRQTLDVLQPALDQGMPVVGLEPACISVFKDELPNLLPGDPLAMRLRDLAVSFGDFVDAHGMTLPRLDRRALVQFHCHHHAVIKPAAEKRVLDRLGLRHRVLPSGCCGMAGSFGFEADKYEVSMAAAERVLLPAVREAAPDTLIVADGFSCREQIEQGTGRRTQHLAEVIAAGLSG